MNTLVIASHNLGKVKEFQDLLSDLDVIVKSLEDYPDLAEIEETGQTFTENALLKARYASKMTGLPAIADDSGLAVSALGGAPGLYSARYAGEEADDAQNRQKLLREMADKTDRQAKFVCCLVFLRHETDPNPIIALGECQGEILHEERGENGFGYDSLFFYPPKGCSFAELSSAEKKSVSHRGNALALLKAQLSC